MAENYDDSMAKFAKDVMALNPNDLELGGIYADKPGYHNKRKNLPASDYSVREFAQDRRGPNNMAAAIDITSKSAQGGNYTIINKYSRRLLAAGQANDPRTDGWREFFGQTDSDRTVEGWDFAKKHSSTSADTSHDWHIHLSELREFVTSQVNKDCMLSILSGETLDSYKNRGGKFIDDEPAPPTKLEVLVVDGKLGSNTIKLWQHIMGTPVDGVISTGKDGSLLVKAVQRVLNTKLHRSLSVDGLGLVQDGKQYETVGALQKYLGTPMDYRMSTPVSDVVKALQKRLNSGDF